jgi:hypothetical protein
VTVDEVGAASGAAAAFVRLRDGHAGRADPRGRAVHHPDGDEDPGASAVQQALGAGGVRLAALQADITGDNAGNGLSDPDPDDGGWDFTIPANAKAHTAAASPTNLFGAIGLGAWAAVDSGSARSPRVFVAALDAETGIQRSADADSAPDFVFGVLLAALADNPAFAQVARKRYDAKLAAFGGAVGLGTAIRDARHAGHEDGLIAYDLGWLTLGAAALDSAFPHAGYDADSGTYAGIVVDDLTSATPRFDFHDPTEGFYVTGLAWSQVASDWQGASALFDQLRTQLLDQQHADGTWGTNAAEPDDDLQATAHALQTMALTDHATPRSQQAASRAASLLLRAQAASGGWPVAANLELPLIDADIMLGLLLTQPDAITEAGLVPGTPLAGRALATGAHAVPAAPLP